MHAQLHLASEHKTLQVQCCSGVYAGCNGREDLSIKEGLQNAGHRQRCAICQTAGAITTWAC